MTDEFLTLFGATAATAEQEAAWKAQDAARNVKRLAAMGLTVGQRVRWDGDEWTIVGAAGADAVTLHCARPGRAGFAAQGAPIPVASLVAA